MQNIKHAKFFVLLFFLCSIIHVKAQNEESQAQSFEPFGITISTGINNVVGMMGIGVYYSFTPQYILEIGVGQGGWGAIGSLQIQYYLPNADNLFLRGAYKRSGGGRDVELNLELIDKSTETILFNFYPVVNAQLTAGKSWTIKNTHRFFIEGGYSYFFGEPHEKYRIQNSQIVLSETSKKALEFSMPGGLIFAIGFAIGL
ncbi:MAG: hypothetical protein M0R02_08370 [Bacteroidales bacterium]|nr:hypothetical protein [Bacteroidales bacterium]